MWPGSRCLSDYLQCLGSALDHLAFELTSAFTVPLTAELERDSAFPVLGDTDKLGTLGMGPGRWSKTGRSATRGMDPLAQAQIQRLQPYNRGKNFDADPLWLLNSLNNIDKHRVLHVVGSSMDGALITVAGARIPKADWPRNVAYLGRADGKVGPAVDGRDCGRRQYEGSAVGGRPPGSKQADARGNQA